MRRVAIVGFVTFVLGLLPGAAGAIDACKVKVDAKDGTLLFSAKNVSGAARWGYAAMATENAFENAATCIAGGVASKCRLGAAGSALAIMPPSLCTLHVADSTSTCAAFVKGCTPHAPQLVVKDSTGQVLGVADADMSGLVFVMVGTPGGVGGLEFFTGNTVLSGGLETISVNSGVFFTSTDCSGPALTPYFDDALLGLRPALVGPRMVANPTDPFRLYTPVGSPTMQSTDSLDAGFGCQASPSAGLMAPVALVATYLPPFRIRLQ